LGAKPKALPPQTVPLSPKFAFIKKIGSPQKPEKALPKAPFLRKERKLTPKYQLSLNWGPTRVLGKTGNYPKERFNHSFWPEKLSRFG